jgi:multidrug efflux system membrane fusion protein
MSRTPVYQRSTSLIARISHFIRTMTPKRFVISLLAIIALWIGLGLLKPGHKPEMAAPTVIASVRATDSQAAVADSTLTLYGTLKAFSAVELRAEADGKIIELPAKEGALLKKGTIIAKLDVRDYGSKLEQARSNLKKRQIESESAQALFAKKLTSNAQLSETKAALDGAKAELIKAQYNVDSRLIIAPVDGVLEKFAVEIGDTVDPMGGKAKIADFIASGAMSVVGHVSENTVHHLHPGQIATVTLGSGVTHPATVTFVGNIADPTTHSFRVELMLGVQDALMRDGMTVEATIKTGTTSAHAILPSTLCLSDEGEMGVKIVDAENKVAFLSVTILSQNTQSMFVTGLPEHATIITLGQASVLPGEIVKVEKTTQEIKNALDH